MGNSKREKLLKRKRLSYYKNKVKHYSTCRKWAIKNKQKVTDYNKLYRLNNLKKLKKYAKKYRLKHKEQLRKKKAEYRKNNSDKIKICKIRCVYHISQKEAEIIFNKVNGVCDICKKKEVRIDKRTNKVTLLAVDHNHKTNKIRGALCSNCNRGLSDFKENINVLKMAIKYLKKHG